MANLTFAEKTFAMLIHGGLNQTDAYKQAFAAKSIARSSATVAASRLANSKRVQDELLRLDREAEKRVHGAIMSREQRMEELSAQARDCRAAGDVRGLVSCIAELNKMDAGSADDTGGVAEFRAAIIAGAAEVRVTLRRGGGAALRAARGRVVDVDAGSVAGGGDGAGAVDSGADA